MCQWQCLGYPQYDAPTTQDGKTILKVLVRVCKSKTQMPQFIGTVPFGLGSPALPGLGTIPSDGGHHCGTCRLLILHLDSLLMCFFTTLQHSSSRLALLTDPRPPSGEPHQMCLLLGPTHLSTTHTRPLSTLLSNTAHATTVNGNHWDIFSVSVSM